MSERFRECFRQSRDHFQAVGHQLDLLSLVRMKKEQTMSGHILVFGCFFSPHWVGSQMACGWVFQDEKCLSEVRRSVAFSIANRQSNT